MADGVSSGATPAGWRVRQDETMRFRVVGPGGRSYAPHRVMGVAVPELRLLHDALTRHDPDGVEQGRRDRVLAVLADAVSDPAGLDEL